MVLIKSNNGPLVPKALSKFEEKPSLALEEEVAEFSDSSRSKMPLIEPFPCPVVAEDELLELAV